MFELADLRIFTEPQQGGTYDDLLAVATRAEQLGFGAFFRSDHLLAMGGARDDGGLPGPTEAWVTLAGLARDTATIRLGTLVSSATFRFPGMLAMQAANVDQMSGGRIELGLGSGWYDDEHVTAGIPFPSLGERFDRLEEQLAIVDGLWTTPVGETFSFAGDHYGLTDSPALPKPVQTAGYRNSIPLIVGGGGRRRTPALAARYATEFNVPFGSDEEFAAARQRVIDACTEIDRDPATMTFSTALVVAVGNDDAEYARRAAAIGRQPDELRQNGIAGTVDEVRESLGHWRELGVERLYLQVLDLSDLDHLDLIATLAA